jgi:RNA recognition motif-containing protein
MFSQFGKILDVVAHKTLRMRGQAWVVFADVAAATNAKNTMQGFPFFEKPIVSGAIQTQQQHQHQQQQQQQQLA